MSFKESLKTKDCVITAHAKLTEALNAASLRRQGEILRPVVDAVQLPDSIEMHMSGIAAAALLMQQGIDPIVHMNCRDRNRIAVQNDLIGAAALGVTSIMVMRGKTIREQENVDARNVFDITALELMAYIQRLKQAEVDSHISGFLVGANAEIFAPEADWTPTNLTRKCDSGANFIQTRLCFDMNVTRNYMASIVASKLTHRANFLMALAPLQSAETARWVRDNIRGALVPEPIIERLALASNPAREGVEICAELMREVATIPGVSGVSLMTFGDIEMIPAAIEASGLRR
jgi:methylenetetrahydrofolate reductase (NADPH)